VTPHVEVGVAEQRADELAQLQVADYEMNELNEIEKKKSMYMYAQRN